ncbi:hypothetical protein Droror1_Dr00015757 [Drosera rotundifolia]
MVDFSTLKTSNQTQHNSSPHKQPAPPSRLLLYLIPPPHSLQPRDSSSSPLHSQHGSYLLVQLGGDDAARCGGAQRLWFDAAAGSQGDAALGFLLLVAADLHSEGGGTWGWNKVAATRFPDSALVQRVKAKISLDFSEMFSNQRSKLLGQSMKVRGCMRCTEKVVVQLEMPRDNGLLVVVRGMEEKNGWLIGLMCL